MAYKPSTHKKNYIIMVPENEVWSALIETHYKEDWSEDFVSNYKNYAMFEKLGLGALMVKSMSIPCMK